MKLQFKKNVGKHRFQGKVLRAGDVIEVNDLSAVGGARDKFIVIEGQPAPLERESPPVLEQVERGKWIVRHGVTGEVLNATEEDGNIAYLNKKDAEALTKSAVEDSEKDGE